MIGAYLTLDDVGILQYCFFYGVGPIAIPARGISRIAVPMVAEAWKTKTDPIKLGPCLYARTPRCCTSPIGLFILNRHPDQIFRLCLPSLPDALLPEPWWFSGSGRDI